MRSPIIYDEDCLSIFDSNIHLKKEIVVSCECSRAIRTYITMCCKKESVFFLNGNMNLQYDQRKREMKRCNL